MSIDLNGVFKVSYVSELSGEDYNVLSQYYLPIMGMDSFSLYLFLYGLSTHQSYQFKKIIDALNFNTPKFIKRALSKLEGLSLVKTYYNEQKGYHLYLKTPACKRAFLENHLLSTLLYNQVGEVEFSKLSKVNTSSPRGYDDVTKSFDDVFEFQEQNVGNIFNSILKLKSQVDIKITNPNFDYVFFKMNFDTEFIDSKIFDDEEFAAHILSTSYNYNLNEEEMKEVVMNTIEYDKDLKFQDISKNARKYYQKKSGDTKKVIVTKEADAFVNSAKDSEQYILVDKLGKMSPIELLTSLNGGIKPAVSEIAIIEELQKNTNFSQAIINVMILLVNNQKEGVLPGYPYFEKIANTWARAGIKNAVEALEYISKENEKRKAPKTTFVKGQKSAPVPDWYESYESQLAELPKAEKLSQEEKAKILAEAKEEL